MKEKGYIKISREVFLSTMWAEHRRFSHFEAWLDIQQRAFYADSKTLKRNEIVLNIRKTAASWGWGRDSVHRFIKDLIGKGILFRTDKKSTYLLSDKKTDSKSDNKHTDNQDTYINPSDKTSDNKQDALPIIKEKKYKRIACACASSENSHAPARTEKTPTPYQWMLFRDWMRQITPSLAKHITEEDYYPLLDAAGGDKNQMAEALRLMEKNGKTKDIMTEYKTALKTWRDNISRKSSSPASSQTSQDDGRTSGRHSQKTASRTRCSKAPTTPSDSRRQQDSPRTSPQSPKDSRQGTTAASRKSSRKRTSAGSSGNTTATDTGAAGQSLT